MIKSCSNCRNEYWAKWRNEPVTLCPECRAGALLCPRCGGMIHPPADPEQLHLFPFVVERPPSRVDTPTVEERYWSLRAKASKSERRRYPYC